ncbi:MAG: hypothetical protein WC428_02405 [Candidatus Paceibacterota bacterium]|jgi:hypothetical protein
MMGILLSFLKNLIWIGFSLIESIMFTLAFNFLAPNVNTIYLATSTWKLPFTHVQYWHVFAFFIVIHYIGQFIQNITPKIVSINNSNKTNEES